MVDYLHDFSTMYKKVRKACEYTQLKYEPSDPYKRTESYENGEFLEVSTELFDIVNFFLLQCVDLNSMVTMFATFGDFYTTIDTYLDTKVFLQSEKVLGNIKKAELQKSRLPIIPWEKSDIYLALHYWEPDKLQAAMDKYGTQEITADNEIIDFLLNSTTYIGEEIVYQSEQPCPWNMLTRIYKKYEICLIFLEKVHLTKSMLDILTKSLTTVFQATMTDKYNYCLLDSNRIKILKRLSLIGKKHLSNDRRGTLLKGMLASLFPLFMEGKEPKYKKDVLTQVTRFFSWINDDNNVPTFVIEVSTVTGILDFLGSNNLFSKEEQTELYVYIFKFVGEEQQKTIKESLKTRKDLSPKEIFWILNDKLLNFHEVSSRTHYLMEQEQPQIDATGDFDSIYHVVIRLNQANCFGNLDEFRKYAHKNYYFQFLLYPEEFHFENFDVQWYDWLNLEKYSSMLTPQICRMLKVKFDEHYFVFDNIDFKSVYYKYFYC